jgi:predicted nucleic acid-binding protein
VGREPAISQQLIQTTELVLREDVGREPAISQQLIQTAELVLRDAARIILFSGDELTPHRGAGV